MQTFRLNQLTPEQQIKLKPIIEQQKKLENTAYKYNITFIFFILIALLCIILPLSLSTTGLLIFILVFFILFFSKFASPSNSVIKNDNDDFYILYGFINNKKDILNYEHSTDRNPYHTYYYVVENQTIKIAENLFENFNYDNLPVGEYRYLLLRTADGKIRKDVTEIF